MKVSYSPEYCVELPEGHPFPMGKFPACREILGREGLVRPADVVEPEPAPWTDLLLAHTPGYLARLEGGGLDRGAERRMGLPWSPGLVRRSRLAVQGTVQAARLALRHGIAANLAGGTHHAFSDRGEGFCVLNDVAVAVRVLRRAGAASRVLVLDLDVHQGNGTARIVGDDPGVFTLSVHAESNYPWRKVSSWRDVPLPDRTGNRRYLEAVARALTRALEAARPDLAFYLAGVDPVVDDRLGRLGLTRAGLRARERLVLETLRGREVPVAVLMSGGYAVTPRATADLHAEVHRVAAGAAGRPADPGARGPTQVEPSAEERRRTA